VVFHVPELHVIEGIHPVRFLRSEKRSSVPK
jgi:hypothetical protein